MSWGDYKQGRLDKLWQGTLASPDRPSLLNDTQSVNDMPRSGCQRVTAVVQDRYIRVRHFCNRTTTATNTATRILGLRRVSDQTVGNRLREAGICPKRPVRRTTSTPRHLEVMPYEGKIDRPTCQAEDCVVL